MSNFLIGIFSNVWTVALVVLFFAGSIFVHELGHFLAARWRGVKVERFSIGFGPALFSWRGRDGVEYRLAPIPLGGYVLLPQLADLGPIEGQSQLDAEDLPPVKYRDKLIVFVAGAFFNVLFAFALACVIWVVGQPTPAELATTQIGQIAPTVKLDDGTSVTNPAIEAGLQAGDYVRTVDGVAVNDFEEVITAIALGRDRTEDGRRRTTLGIERNGQAMSFTVYPRLVGDEGIRSAGIAPPADLVVDFTMPGSPAEKAGVLPGDKILALDGTPVYRAMSVSEHLAKNAGRAVDFLFRRDGKEIHLAIQPRSEIDPTTKKPVVRVGIQYREPTIITHPSPFYQIGSFIVKTFKPLVAALSPHSDIGPSKFTGPIGMVGELYHQARVDFRGLLWFTIVINVNLAIFNLLPIPVLDGGQVLFATISRLRGRPLPLNLIITMQGISMVLLLTMVIYVCFFDVARLRRDARAAAPPPPAAAAPAKP